MSGGIARVAEILQTLVADMTAQGLTTALDAAQETPSAQRLGALLAQMGQISLANLVADWLGTRRTRRIPVTMDGATQGPSTLNTRFKVNMPDTRIPANT